MVSLFGTASESCLEIADRAPCACCVRCRRARGCRTCEALVGVSTARAVVWGSRHAGSKGTRRSPACGEWRPRSLPPALRVAHCLRIAERQQEHAGPRALGGFELARLYSLRALVGKRLARGESTPRFSPPPSGGRPEGGWGRLSHRLPHPHWHIAPAVGGPATSSATAAPSPTSQIDVEVDVDRAARHAVDGVVVRR